jgi:hypothetical protein
VDRHYDFWSRIVDTDSQDRLQLLSTLVDSLPDNLLHLITELITEAVLGTKEVNEKARDAGFDLLVVMGHKMARGGSVTRKSGEEDEEEMGGESHNPPRKRYGRQLIDYRYRQGQCGRVHYDDRCRTYSCDSPHDQCQY